MLAIKTPGRTSPLCLALTGEDILKGQRLGPLNAMLGLEGSVLMCSHKSPQALSLLHLNSDSCSPSKPINVTLGCPKACGLLLQKVGTGVASGMGGA